ncbi:alpha/beta hydrolase [Nosocomiicoccus sp. HMSC059G07]|uniref:alpha/beta hydrolase n=1 Tax=Nosocomiicoccus sp. HMSC059G07 TaxID=1739531 RepID=UPI0008A4277A|nr:alpha/beta hydrolase [Nosocomiicoccus sp. HMSC059G07]OFO53752.1 hypothetical protein HMPREF3029_05275 [Nosocomiicoccus sp. HMSC059G07]
MWKWEIENKAKGTIVILHDMIEHHEYYIDLISKFNSIGYHVLMGDLPGQGQTTRMNKGHVEDFKQYIERLTEWVDVANRYELPVIVVGQGLGGLILAEALKEESIQIDGAIFLNPLFTFKQSFINRKNLLKSSIRLSRDESKFKLGVDLSSFTSDNKWLERYSKDELLTEEVSYHWYSLINERMNNIENDMDLIHVDVLCIHSNENDIIDVDRNVNIIKKVDNGYLKIVRLNNIEHGIFQRENISVPFYHLERFLDDIQHRIGFMG